MSRADDLFNAALGYARAGDWAGALPLFLDTLQQDRNHPEAALKVIGHAQETASTDILEQLLARLPAPVTHADSNRFLAQAARILGRTDAAEAFRSAAETQYQQAIERNPADHRSHRMLGELYYYLAEPEKAIKSFDTALRYASERAKPGILADRGMAFRALHAFDRAGQDFRDATALDRHSNTAHRNLALLLLLLGRYPEGLEQYEWRRALPGQDPPARPILDHWNGRTVVLVAEQGAGDQVQMLRYARQVRERAARVYVTCNKGLVGVVERAAGVARVLLRGSTLPAHDHALPVMSLPYAFGTEVGSLPRDPYPYLPRDGWGLRDLGAHQDALCADGMRKIGVVWCGSVFIPEDHCRSCPLAAFAPLLEMSGIRWFALQPRLRPGDAELLRRYGVHDLGPVIRGNYAATAAAIGRLDCVVSVDTSVVHLAGAMGRRVLVALPDDPDWRWLLDREDCPCYPSVTLIRQPRRGDWASVIQRIWERL